MLRKLLSNQTFRLAAAVVVGGILTALFMQETIIKKKEQQSFQRQQDLTAQISQTKSLLAEKDKELSKHQTIEHTKETHPDGSTNETTTVVTDTQLIEKARLEERQVLEQKYSQQISEYENKIKELSVHKNPKRLDLYLGTMPSLSGKFTYLGGFNYPLWGPLTFGVAVTSNGLVTPTLGIRF